MPAWTAEPLHDRIVIRGLAFSATLPPLGFQTDAALGLVRPSAMCGKVLHTNEHGGLFETRATITPSGDYLLMFPDSLPNTNDKYNGHYGGKKELTNRLVAFRSKDGGETWSGPTVPFEIDYNQHGFIPLIPRGSKRIYGFGTQPIWNEFSTERGQGENAPIGFRYSDDDGYTWSDVTLIRPVNDPGFKGMSVMRMCETASGAWLLGAHEGDWSYKPLMTRQYILRSEDQGQTWHVLPHARHGGWCVPQFNRMDEGRPIDLGEGRAFCMIRTCEGHLWGAWSDDNGKSWTAPKPTPLVHPDAPPMLFHLSDGKTLAAFHHNEHADLNYQGLDGRNECQSPRRQVWVSFSSDGARTWSEPRFVLANALAPRHNNAWMDHQCSYLDAFADRGELHLFMPHRWHRALHLRIAEKELLALPTAKELSRLNSES
ncbi:MAG: hypothetical protein AMXMBFR7_05500 [Planctomycetota bacterium]